MHRIIQHPHDTLFRTVFRDLGEAQRLLEAHLAPTLVQALDWATLRFEHQSTPDRFFCTSLRPKSGQWCWRCWRRWKSIRRS